MAGFDAIPAPPTFTFAMPFWGCVQPRDQPPDPTGVARNPMHTIMGELFAKGALGAARRAGVRVPPQPVEVGDVLDGGAAIPDIYEKETDSAHMTFVVMQTEWTDARLRARRWSPSSST